MTLDKDANGNAPIPHNTRTRRQLRRPAGCAQDELAADLLHERARAHEVLAGRAVEHCERLVRALERLRERVSVRPHTTPFPQPPLIHVPTGFQRSTTRTPTHAPTRMLVFARTN